MRLRVCRRRTAFAAGILFFLSLAVAAETAQRSDVFVAGIDKDTTSRSSGGRNAALAGAFLGGGPCGNGVIDEGEQCDPPDGACCDTSCHFEPDGASCPNGVFCDGQETCQAGECVDGPDPPCDDHDPCTTNGCYLTCVFTRIPNCRSCETPNDCEDGNPCTDDACVRPGDDLGVCERSDSPDGLPCPDDGNPCTDDVCDGAGTCEHSNDDSNDCTDDDFCNGQETCQAGECVDGSEPCIDPAHCDEADDVCWECIHPDECLDDDPCTEDDCVDNACANNRIPGCCLTDDECIDGNACTTDECLDNECVNDPITDCCLADDECVDDNVCTTDGCLDYVCVNEPIPGCCLTDDDCVDDDPCTDDACTDNVCVHTPQPGCDMVVYLDIKPGSCPNPVNPKSRGVVPMAVVGSESFDVADIDIDSLWLGRGAVRAQVQPLMGPPGPGITIDDVATPVGGGWCECAELGGDGIDDLLLKFDTVEMVAALELDTLQSGVVIKLTLSGTLLDGTPFTADDCILIPGKKPRIDRSDWRP